MNFICNIHSWIALLKSQPHLQGANELTHKSTHDLTLTWILVHIGSGNGLLPDGTKPLPEPMLTNHQWTLVALINDEYHINAQDFYLWYKFGKYSFKLHMHLLRANELTHWPLVTPYGDKDLGQLWLRQWLVAWWHQAITWTNVDYQH